LHFGRNALKLLRHASICGDAATWTELEAGLLAEGIALSKYLDLDVDQKSWLDGYFRDTIYPVLTPLAFDPGRPFRISRT